MTKRSTLAIGLLCMALGMQVACDDDDDGGGGSGDGDGDGVPGDGSGDGTGDDGSAGDGTGDGGGDGDGTGDGEPDGPKGTVSGFVFDTSSPPVGLEGVVVVAPGGARAATDASGAFSLEGVNVGESVVVMATDDDHSTGVRNVAVFQNYTGYVDFYLHEAVRTAFDPVKGGTVKTANGGTATFPPDGLTRKDGSAPVGEVTVVVSAVDPTKGSQKKALPGQSTATKDGKSGAIETYAPMEVRVVDSENKELQVKADKKARLDFPVSPEIPNPPAELDNWSLDETTGIWRFEGTSRRIRDDLGRVLYSTEIPHMSWWGSHAFIDQLTCVRACVKDAAGDPVPGASVTLTGLDFRFFETRSAGGDGCFAANLKQTSAVSILAASASGVSSLLLATTDDMDKRWEEGVTACQDLGVIELADRPAEGACPAGYTACDGTCYDLNNDGTKCGATCDTATFCGAGDGGGLGPYGSVCSAGECVCPVGWENCDGSCINTQNNPNYCGSCTGQTACDQSESYEVCENGACVPLDCGDLTICYTFRGGYLGCADLDTSLLHCGACNANCGNSEGSMGGGTGGFECSAGVCGCEDGFEKCTPYSQSPTYFTCAEFDVDPENCGGCYQNADVTNEDARCDYNTEICTDGTCTELTCPGAGGLACYRQCVDSLTDENNCGGCDSYCNTGRSEQCVNGECGCAVGQTNCETGCVDTQTDENNCGACGGAPGSFCEVGTECVAGVCQAIQCDAGETLCGSECVDTDTTRNHCGACYRNCGNNPCSDGQCVCPGDQILCCSESQQPYCAAMGSTCECVVPT